MELVLTPSATPGVTRARHELGFVVRTSLEDGLRKSIDWYKAHR